MSVHDQDRPPCDRIVESPVPLSIQQGMCSDSELITLNTDLWPWSTCLPHTPSLTTVTPTSPTQTTNWCWVPVLSEGWHWDDIMGGCNQPSRSEMWVTLAHMHRAPTHTCANTLLRTLISHTTTCTPRHILLHPHSCEYTYTYRHKHTHHTLHQHVMARSAIAGNIILVL